MTLLIERDHVIEAMAAGLPIGDEDLERLGLGDGADRRRLSEWVSGAAPGPLPPGIAPVNVDLLRATLNDDDPAGFVAEVAGMTAADIADALRPAAAERAADYLPIAAQKRRGGMGGFAPVVALAYDERMLLHEEGSADGGGGGRRLTSSVPGVRLPPQPLSLHPERPDRLRAIAQHLVVTGLFQRCRCGRAASALPQSPAGVGCEAYLTPLLPSPRLAGASLRATCSRASSRRCTRRATSRRSRTCRRTSRCAAAPLRSARLQAAPSSPTHTLRCRQGEASTASARTRLPTPSRSARRRCMMGQRPRALLSPFHARHPPAQLACGSVVAVTQAVARGEADRGVALVRPPGHHAEPDAALGFCLYNNVSAGRA